MALAADFPLDLIEVKPLQTVGRKHRRTSLLLDSQNDVAAAEILEIVGEGANGPNRGVPNWRVPRLFELPPCGFHRFRVDQVIDGDWQYVH